MAKNFKVVVYNLFTKTEERKSTLHHLHNILWLKFMWPSDIVLWLSKAVIESFAKYDDRMVTLSEIAFRGQKWNVKVPGNKMFGHVVRQEQVTVRTVVKFDKIFDFLTSITSVTGNISAKFKFLWH